MSEAMRLLEQARGADDPAAADRLALRAIAAEPDLAAAYALRGRLAAERGDPVVAAHYFRVAYARGDRAAATCAGLSVCLEAIGQVEVAARIRDGASLPPELDGFEEAARALAPALRQVLGGPLPARGVPALLPGERLPAGAATAAREGAGEDPPAASTPRAEPPPAGRPPAGTAEPGGARTRRLSQPPPAWLDTAEPPPPPDEVSRADWVVTATDLLEEAARGEGGGAAETVEPGGIELTVDPGTPDFAFRSPVTGRVVRPEELARQREGARAPELLIEDPLELEPLLRESLKPGARLRVAVPLPGPVMTGPGMGPRTLCRRVALGVTAGEVLLRDRERGPEATVRIPASAVRRLDIVADGQQLSLVLTDGRQIHLDLRQLRRRTPRTAHRVTEALTRMLAPAS